MMEHYVKSSGIRSCHVLFDRRLRAQCRSTLPRFAADLEWLKSKGIWVERYNLAQETAAFAGHPLVKAALHSQGAKSLPLILVEGRVVAQGSYPTRAQLAESVGISHEPEPIISQVKGSSPLVSIAGKSGSL